MNISDFLDKDMRQKLQKTNNNIAGFHLFTRITVELVLIYMLYQLIQNNNWTLAIIIFFMVAIWHSFWGYAGIAHELFHQRVFSLKILNRIFFKFSSYLVWNNPYYFEKSHINHHRDTFSKNDQEASSIQKWDTISIISYISVDPLLIYRKIKYCTINTLGFEEKSGKLSRCSREIQLEAIKILTLNLFIQIILWISFQNHLLNILYFLIPFSAQILTRILAQSQHIGLHQKRKEGPLSHSRTIILPKVLEFLYAGMNYHSEHHFLPSVPYYNLPKLHKILMKKQAVDNVENITFLFSKIWVIIKEHSVNQKKT